MRTTGTVKFFNSAKGFGFIQPESGDKDVFVHATALEAAGIPRSTRATRSASCSKTTGKVAASKPDRSRKPNRPTLARGL